MKTERKPKAVSPFTPYLKGSSKFILGLKNVFSEQECQELINRSEQHVYESALVNFGGAGYVVDKRARDSDRVMLDDPTAAAEIFRRVRPWLPDQIGGCHVCGVNERLRFLRYNTAQQFAPHYDGCYKRPDGRELSFLTIQVTSVGRLHQYIYIYVVATTVSVKVAAGTAHTGYAEQVCLPVLQGHHAIDTKPLNKLQHVDVPCRST